MKFFAPLFALFALVFAAFVHAAPESSKLHKRYSTPVLYPKTGVVWLIGQPHNVTWSLKNAPSTTTPCVRKVRARAVADTVNIAFLKNGAFYSSAATGVPTLAGRYSTQTPGTPGSYTVRLTHSSGDVDFGSPFTVSARS